MTFDAAQWLGARAGHATELGIRVVDQGPDWVELALPPDDGQDARLMGPLLTLADMAAGYAVWVRRGRFAPQATLDLRVDLIRPARTGTSVVARAICERLDGSVAVLHGAVHDGDPGDPVARLAATYMALAA